jgi:outer membrane protein
MSSDQHWWRELLPVASVLLLAVSSVAAAQESSGSADTMSVDQAVRLALANNRTLKIVSLSVEGSREKLLAEKTRRLPSFKTYVFGAESLTTINFTVQKGQFGTYPATGPIPATNTEISTSQTPTAYIIASVSQPLLTLYKINLHIRGQQLTVEQNTAKLLEQRQTIVANVRQAYYQILQIESAIEAADSNVKQYQELDRITQQYVTQKTALKSENLDVKSKLAQQQYSLLQYQDKLQTAKENLNDLLGRDLNTDFRAVPVADMSVEEVDLKAAQVKALDQHPQIKEAEITVKQADNARRQAKAQYVPDINAAIHYISPFGVQFLPTNVAGVGLEMDWEPFDWGRRKHEVNESVVSLEQSKLSLTETKEQVLLNVDNQFRLLHEARIAVAVATAQKESSREKLREVTLQYEQKTALLRDVLQQQAAEEGADASYDQALASFWTTKANFKKALGEE